MVEETYLKVNQIKELMKGMYDIENQSRIASIFHVCPQFLELDLKIKQLRVDRIVEQDVILIPERQFTKEIGVVLSLRRPRRTFLVMMQKDIDAFGNRLIKMNINFSAYILTLGKTRNENKVCKLCALCTSTLTLSSNL